MLLRKEFGEHGERSRKRLREHGAYKTACDPCHVANVSIGVARFRPIQVTKLNSRRRAFRQDLIDVVTWQKCCIELSWYATIRFESLLGA